jgi:hypothetical protein
MGMIPKPPLNDWDRRIMESLPFVADLADPRDFDESIDWLKAEFDRSDFTWKGMRFFFRDPEEWMMFSMRWT